MRNQESLTLALVLTISILATSLGIQNLYWYVGTVDQTIVAVLRRFP
jgi:hypothetical protein